LEHNPLEQFQWSTWLEHVLRALFFLGIEWAELSQWGHRSPTPGVFEGVFLQAFRGVSLALPENPRLGIVLLVLATRIPQKRERRSNRNDSGFSPRHALAYSFVLERKSLTTARGNLGFPFSLCGIRVKIPQPPSFLEAALPVVEGDAQRLVFNF